MNPYPINQNPEAQIGADQGRYGQNTGAYYPRDDYPRNQATHIRNDMEMHARPANGGGVFSGRGVAIGGSDNPTIVAASYGQQRNNAGLEDSYQKA